MTATRAPDSKFIAEAIQLAVDGVSVGSGGPFGAVVVREGRVVGRGSNCVTSRNDPTAHAEIVAIRDACATLGTFDLSGCELYASCEPCPMCLSAAYWARVDRVYFAADREAASQAGFDDGRIYLEIALSPEKRSLPMTRVQTDDAARPFEAWKRKNDKIPY